MMKKNSQKLKDGTSQAKAPTQISQQTLIPENNGEATFTQSEIREDVDHAGLLELVRS